MNNNYAFLQNIQNPQENGNLGGNLGGNLLSLVARVTNVPPNSNELFFQEINSVDWNNGNGNSEIEERVNRNYEALMLERNQEINSAENNIYNKIFNEIKNKLLIISDDNTESVSESIKNEYLEKNFLTGVHGNINKLKKIIVETHNKKIELDILFNEASIKFKKFSDLVIATVNIIKDSNDSGDSNDPSDSSDVQLCDLLMNKIGKYFLFLDLENLTNSVNSINKEYLCIKNLFYELSGTLPATVCQICLENQINYFIDPCGHTICTYCKEKRPGLQKCHFCRANISTFKRLYL